jgi:heptosyltransferase-3
VERLNLPAKFVVVHTSSNESCRNWQAELWNNMAEVLFNRFGLTVIEVGQHAVLKDNHEKVVNLCKRLSLLETLEVIRQARLFVGIDSGPAHMANAVGTPGVILLGHYRRFKRYCPYTGGYGDGSNAELVQYDGPVVELPLEAALNAVMRRLALADERRLQEGYVVKDNVVDSNKI